MDFFKVLHAYGHKIRIMITNSYISLYHNKNGKSNIILLMIHCYCNKIHMDPIPNRIMYTIHLIKL